MAPRSDGSRMQDVVLDDDAGPSAREADFRSSVLASVRWGERHLVLASFVVLAVVTAAVTAVVGLPRWSEAAERRALALPAAASGLVRALPAAPVARWSAAIAWDGEVLLVGDTVVTWSPWSGEGGVTGLDLVTGAERWHVPIDDAVPGTRRHCVGGFGGVDDESAGRVVCLSVVGHDLSGGRGPGISQTGPVVVIDADRGDAVRRELDGAAVDAVMSGTDLVLVVARANGVDLVRQDVLSGSERWSVGIPVGEGRADVRRVRLEERGGVVLVSGGGVARVVDARNGRPVIADLTVPPRLHDVDLLSDGTVVASQYGVGTGALRLTSTLYGTDGRPRFTVAGAVGEPAVTDDPARQLYAWSALSGGPFGGRVRAIDRVTGATSWLAPGPSAGVLLDVGGVAVLKGAGYAIGTDAATGAQLWRQEVSINTAADLMSDGTRVLLVRVEPGKGAVLEAVLLQDGSSDWEVELPAGVTRVEQHGALLLGVGPGIVVSLR